ncbi:DUF805 domain-containing protein [Pelagibacterium xiamenense]|uniref:DUF805 domain-containing protein n=1 Tax=Pelagibacterium xiamenense TaxID=2901140 RepID=UPI001E28C1FB|nr:DUF805 domain-containing protein [Pelagibacterium xiamenense]MCD7060178.1 DUF805 domain-containing protein [Pelagibacterium xiamenense]
MALFTTFEGRINRQRFWLGVIAIIAVSILGGIVFTMIAGSNTGLLVLLSSILSLVLLYPGLAIGIKRLHDRNKSATPWAYIFFGPGILVQVMQVFGIGFSAQTSNGMSVVMPNALGAIVLALAAIVGIWALIELGFLKGTTGTNHYGPDPLQQ